jgi:hypothetical protein
MFDRYKPTSFDYNQRLLVRPLFWTVRKLQELNEVMAPFQWSAVIGYGIGMVEGDI